MNMPLRVGVRCRCHGSADKNLGYSGVLGDPLGRVNGRQEGKLTHGAGNRNGKAEGMFRLRVFLAIHDQYLLLPDRNLV